MLGWIGWLISGLRSGRVLTGIALLGIIGFSFALGFKVGESTSDSAENVDLIASTTESLRIVTQVAIDSTPSPTPQPTDSATQTATTTPTDGPSPTPTITADVMIHTVRPGDNLYRLSQQYSVPVELIVASNNLPNPESIAVGQGLIIPMNGVAAPSPTLIPSQTPIPPMTAEPMVEVAMAGTGDDDLGIMMVMRPVSLQGVPVDSFIIMPDAVKANVQAIYAHGQELGRNPHAFSKVGDSTIENPHFLTRFDTGPYDLGNFAYLQDVVDHYLGSFSREGLAVRRGLHSWALNDPLWADPTQCLPEEGVVACELRVHNASVIFFRLGSNDVGRPDLFEENMRQAIESAIAQGVIPIIGTKADRNDGQDSPNNTILRGLAAEYQIPLWDFDLIANIIPDRGLGPDQIHMTTFYAHDWTSAVAFERGHGVHNLTALMMLDALLRVVGTTDVSVQTVDGPS